MAALLGAATLFAKEPKTLVVTPTPQMHCEGCENKIKNNLRFEKGVRSIETDLANQTVTVGYDAEKTTAEQLIKSFSKIGYTVKVIEPAKSKTADKAAK